jgi:acyl-CoA synthetase (NDP forming)
MVGASNNVGSIGGQVFANLVRAFRIGPVHPVHPRDPEVQGLVAYPSISELPEAVDLAVIAVPAERVPRVIEECGERGVGGALIITSGFAEAGPDGAKLQDEVAAVAREGGVRVNGPNCIGYMNLFGGVMANFALPPTAPLPRPGPVALVSQSGGFGSYITNKALLAGLRLGWFVSTGNEVDCNIAAVLRYLVERDETRVLMVFSETMRDPEVFIEAASRAAELDKPVVVLKAGRSDEAARAALSHTASIVGSSRALDAVCRQYSVFVVRTMEEMLDLGMIFQDGRRVRDRRVGVLTTSGGAGVLLADASAAAGLTVPELPAEEQRALLDIMPVPFYGSTANPVDTTAQVVAFPDAFRKVLFAFANSSTVDMLAPVTWAAPGPNTDALIHLYQSTDKPIAITSTAWMPETQEAGVPTYTDPNRAMAALGAVAEQSLRPRSLAARPPWHPDPARAARARAVLARAAGHPALLESTSKELLAVYGVPVPDEVLVTRAADAPPAARRLGRRVALKVMSYQLPHKTEAGAIRLNLTAEDVAGAYEDMMAEVRRRAPDAAIEGVLVSEMVPVRLEMTCGLQRDALLGPIVAVGLGGILVEILSEAAMLRPPFAAEQARHAIGGLLGGRLVAGGRGLGEGEQEQLARLMVALGDLALELEEVVEVDVNPVMVADGSVRAADALVVVSGAGAAGSAPGEAG